MSPIFCQRLFVIHDNLTTSQPPFCLWSGSRTGTLSKWSPPRSRQLQSCYIRLNVLPHTQHTQAVSAVRDLGLFQNTGLGAKDSVARTSYKTRRFFYLMRPFPALTPSIFLPLSKAFIRPHLEYAIKVSSLSLPGTVQKLAEKVH